MQVLIVQGNDNLGDIWQRHLERQGMSVFRALDQDQAIKVLSETPVNVIVLDLVLRSGAALAVADYANYRQPNARVIFVTNTSFFSDGSIFAHVGNACAFLPSSTPPSDLAAMIEHHSGEEA